MLSYEGFLSVVRDAPLVAIDLIVENEHGRILTGLRLNAPAQGYWFVPGGRIRKGESLDAAFSRVCVEELGLNLARNQASLLGLYENFYDDNFSGKVGISTHYVVLAHRLQLPCGDVSFPVGQHCEYQWRLPVELAADLSVHANTRAYFLE